MRRLEKEKGKATEDARLAEEKEKERVRIGGIQKAVRIHENELIPQDPIKAEIRLQISDRNASLSAEVNALIAKKIANAATCL